MIDPRDRLLERSLVRLLDGEREAPDLAPRVLDAWQRGVRGQPVHLDAETDNEGALEDLHLESAGGTSRWPLRVGIAAALAAALGAGLWRAREWTGAGVGTSAGTPAEPIAGEGPAAPKLSHLEEPWRALEPTALPAAFGTLEAMAGAVLTVDGEGVHLGSGALRVAAETATAVHLPGGARLDLAAGCRAQVELWLDRPPAPGDADLGAWWSGELAESYGLLSIDVAGEGASLTGLDAPRTLEGPSRYYVGPRGTSEDLGQGAALAAELASLPADDLPIPGRIERWTRAPLDGPLVALREDPALWLEAETILGKLFAPDAVPAALQDILVDALAQDRSPIAERVLREAWMDVPERFSSDAIVTLADRGLPEFVREVHGVFRHRNVAGSAEGDALPLALWLALQGKGDGALALAESLDFESEEFEGRFRTGAAAVGLARLGDRRPWIRFRKQTVARIEESLAADDLKGAISTLAGLEYLTALLEDLALPLPEYPVQPAYAGSLADEYAKARSAAYSTADEVHADLRAVLDR